MKRFIVKKSWIFLVPVSRGIHKLGSDSPNPIDTFRKTIQETLKNLGDNNKNKL